MSEWSPPREFDGYELRRRIGQGGMGEVYLAHDTLLDRDVAIKFVLASTASPAARERFMIEARAIARLQHPNVVSVYRVGEIAGRPYLVSEFVPGRPLSEVPTPVSSATALRIAMDVAHALAAAHGRGVVHRDIKPANAILSDDGVVKLLDFGIAKLVEHVVGAPDTKKERAGADSHGSTDGSRDGEAERSHDPAGDATEATRKLSLPAGAPLAKLPRAAAEADRPARPCADAPPPSATGDGAGAPWPRQPAAQTIGLTGPGAALGTPRYMAPEVWLGEPATFASDVYSFGALLYTLCAGHPPFATRDLDELRRQVIAERPTPLAQEAPHLEAGLCAVVDRCLAREPSGRFAAGGELRASLARLLPGARRDEVPEGNPYRGLRPFEQSHRDLFFGRDSEIRMILDRLRTDSFVLVAGDSGVGKSSLCRAGVLPRLQAWMGQARTWHVVAMVPGRRPVAALSAALAPLLDDDDGELARTLAQDPGGVARQLRAWQGKSRGIVVLLDQLEELVTLSEPAEASAFGVMLGWLLAPAPGTRVLGSVRGDFLSRIASLPGMADEISRALYFLRPLSAERIREAIANPAQLKGVSFEPDSIVDELVAATRSGDGSLPLLQFALAELWEAREQETGHITRATLHAVGGVAGALTRHADGVLGQLGPAARTAARQLLLGLVSSEGTRLRMSAAELELGAVDAALALDALVRGRLLVARDTPEGPSYEIAHEALIVGWSTLASWRSADVDAQRVRERLARAVQEWERLGKQRDALWQGRQLDELRGLDARRLSAREQLFVARSRAAQRRARRSTIALAIGVPLLAAGVYFGVWRQQRLERDARVRAKLDEAAQILADARAVQARSEELRQAAFRELDRPARDRGEQLWTEHLALLGGQRTKYARASQLLETALLLDPSRPDARQRLASLLYQRALAAEQRHDRVVMEELLQRLALYDGDGALRRQWDEPARLSVSASPPDASIAVGRYLLGAGQRYQLEPVAGLAAGTDELALPPGSYLLTLEAPGRATVRQALVLHRDEHARLELELPRAEEVPRGFVYVPPGRFLFGSAAPEGQRRDFFHTAPLHEVETGGYLIAIHETTFADWLGYLEALPAAERRSRIPHVGAGGFQGALGLVQSRDGAWELSIQPTTQAYRARQGEPITYPGRKQRAQQDWSRFPVSGIAVADAEQYVAWLRSSGRVPGARLCTEHEWERAARGADGREYPHGEVLEPDDANYDETYGKVTLAMGPDEIGSHPASRSPWLLDDMAGNVWEWTRSSLVPGEYAARGGSYYFGPSSSRATDREVTEPSFRDVSVGLRVCADPPAARPR